MAVPEVPSRKLAELVLGYLAEEHLMTAYDEFLHTSPYLDALHNEYDRIFMTSLKHIVAEYRALRIEIETCQPFVIRKHLMQLPNLVEVVRFLIKNVDLHKANPATKYSSDCNTLPHTSQQKQEQCNKSASHKPHSQVNRISLDDLVETTSLADLPGSNKSRKKRTWVLEKKTSTVTPFITKVSEREAPKATQADTSRSHLDGSVQNACSLSFKPNIHDIRNKSIGPTTERFSTETFQDFSSGMQVTQVSRITTESANSENPNTLTQHVTNASRDPKSIKILSDVKVDGETAVNKVMMPTVVQNATSTPLVKTLMINGNPAYKAMQSVNRIYSKDEIMAMQTLFLVPAPGPPPPHVQPIQIQASFPPANTSVSSTCTEPLTIDITSESPVKQPVAEGVVTTLNLDLKNASVPKDSIVTVGKTNTPQVLPPVRKSSSTPRRTSHVRVLDFTTPRRILHGTIQETEEVVLSRSPNLIINEDDTSQPKKEIDAKKDKTLSSKKQNWDADLRALVAASIENATPSAKPKPKRAKKKISKDTEETPKTDKKKSSKKKPSPKTKSAKKSRKSSEPKEIVTVETEPIVQPEVTVKPTINIITEWNKTEKEDKNDKSANKSNELQSDTPEMDRISLENAIGAKLNISDLLETPYKQALYDIQMDTPQFLRPDIPINSAPTSEIKITDIPTPRFLNTPGLQMTPYANRPTDYSSGGSYYNPEDQPIPDLDSMEIKTDKVQKEVEEIQESKPSRPVRKCTKNISYCGTKPKTIENTEEEHSQDSEILNVTSDSVDMKKSDESEAKPIKEKAKPKETKSSTVKSRRSSKKGTPNKFMKIKPRRPTPVKSSSKSKKSTETHKSGRKRTSSKEKGGSSATPAPTKSRRKSSTPRKLHTKVFSSESLDTNSSESTNRGKEMTKLTVSADVHDSDVDNMPLRWSDDGSRCSTETGHHRKECNSSEIEDIDKIKKYIESTEVNASLTPSVILPNEDENSSLHIDLVKRGFDIETAKILERDLLEACPVSKPETSTGSVKIINLVQNVVEEVKITSPVEASKNVDKKDNEEEEEDDVELSIHECNNESTNFIVCEHDARKRDKKELARIKDTYSMEICIEDDVLRLRVTQYKDLFAISPDENFLNTSYTETEAAINSISNIDKLYTPLKESRMSVQEQCREIFDSTLTSLDTPIKTASPKRKDVSVVEMVESVEKEDVKDKTSKKRKRVQNSPDTATDSKKNKKDTRCLQTIQNINNFDIESVLSKLHGSK